MDNAEGSGRLWRESQSGCTVPSEVIRDDLQHDCPRVQISQPIRLFQGDCLATDSNEPQYAIDWLREPIGSPGPACPKCGSLDTVVNSAGTRAAGRGDVQFCYCTTCSHSWAER